MSAAARPPRLRLPCFPRTPVPHLACCSPRRYTVNVGEPGTTWGIKYGVESGSIAPADHIVAMAGDFTSGLRVTVPHLGSRIKHRPVDRDDVTGEIHGFDINDLTYSVRLEGGKIVRGIKGDQIRPLPRKKALG